MNKLLAAVCMVLFFTLAFADASTIAWWTFNDGTPGAPMAHTSSGSDLSVIASADQSGNGNDLMAWAAYAAPSFSYAGQTTDYTGLSTRIVAGQDAYTSGANVTGTDLRAITPVQWTIEVDVMLTGDISGFRTFVGRDGSNVNSSDSQLAPLYFQKSSDGKFSIKFVSAGRVFYTAATPWNVEANKWYRLAAVSDGSVLRLYADRLDGNGYQLEASTTLSGNTALARSSATAAWTIGRGRYNNQNVDWFGGFVNNVRISDTALTVEHFLPVSPIVIVMEGASLNVTEGGQTDSYTVGLKTQPQNDVTITVTPDEQFDLGVGRAAPIVLTFTPLNWEPQTITVAAYDDDEGKGDHVGEITHTVVTSDPLYFAALPLTVRVNIADNECPALGCDIADLNCDCIVNLEDLALFAAGWISEPITLHQIAASWLRSTDPSDENAEPADRVFMFSYFNGDGDGLHLAYSFDGLNWTALRNDGLFLTPQIGSNLMRDPSILRGKDGLYHLVWTTGWWDNGFGYARSADLVNWSAQQYIYVGTGDNTWAPDLFYDATTDQYLIIWASRVNSSSPHKQYVMTTPDFETFSAPMLYYDPGFSAIDITLEKVEDTYYGIVKDERDEYKNLLLVSSPTAYGPFSQPLAQVAPGGSEGPAIIRVDDRWILYWDVYGQGRYAAAETRDFVNWAEISDQLSLPSGIRHGTVFRTDRQTLDTLLTLE